MPKYSSPLRAPPIRSPWQQFRNDPVTTTMRWLYSQSPQISSAQDAHSPSPTVQLVCISDTHNAQPSVPEGDILLHAGDLTNGGTLHELQSQLTWLASLPHKHKIVIGGNHDRLLDRTFVEQHPERITEMQGNTRSDLDWHDIIYLQDSATTIKIAHSSAENENPPESLSRTMADRTASVARALKIYGSAMTPSCGTFAFQYPPSQDVWHGILPDDVDIVVCHGPPRGFLDYFALTQGNMGCPHFLREISRVRPRVVVFGHIHSGFGERAVHWARLLDKSYVRFMIGNLGGLRGRLKQCWLLLSALLGYIGTTIYASVVPVLGMETPLLTDLNVTLMVNAAIGTKVDEPREAIIVQV